MLLRLLLAQLLLVAARAAAEDKPEAGKGEPSELFLFCNTTSACLVRQGASGATLVARVLPPPPLPPPHHISPLFPDPGMRSAAPERALPHRRWLPARTVHS